MTEEKVMQVMAVIGNKIPEEKRIIVRDKLRGAEDSKAEYILSVKLHETVNIVLLSVFLGGLGIDRFVIGDTGLGVGKLLLGWLTVGIWPFVDIFFSYRKAKEKNYMKIMSLI